MQSLGVDKFEDLIGKPFVDDGRGPDGYDCVGLCLEIFTRMKIPVSDYNKLVFPEINNKEQKAKVLLCELARDWVPVDTPEYGILVVIDYPFPGWSTHVGVCINAEQFIQALGKTGVCISRFSSPAWRKRIRGFYKYNYGQPSRRNNYN
jgi:cell wall-associated NlpC family hydrolase